MHGNEVFQRVRHALAQIEAERNVRVLYACESGSRAWGLPRATATTMCASSTSTGETRSRGG